MNILRLMKDTVSNRKRYFLAKTDPETYPLEQLEQERQTVWDGVKNPQALRAIRDMKSGDRVFIYHSMGDAAVVGVADVVGAGRADPKNANSPWPTSASAAASSLPSACAKSRNRGCSTTGRWCAKAGFPPWPRPSNSWSGCAPNGRAARILNSGSQHGRQVADSKNGIALRKALLNCLFSDVEIQIPRKYSGIVTATPGERTGVFGYLPPDAGSADASGTQISAFDRHSDRAHGRGGHCGGAELSANPKI